MERSTPVRKPYTSTTDLLTWSETPPTHSQPPGSAPRSNQPSDGISKVVFGGQVTDEEVESLNKRKPCSEYKMKDITGSGIFGANGENDTTEAGSFNPPPNKTGLRMYQQVIAGMSHISFSEEESVSPKKRTTLPEVAKQRELSGTLESEDSKMKKQFSDAKCKELSGHDIFAPPPEIKPRQVTPRILELKGSTHIGEPAVQHIDGDQRNTKSTEEPVTKTAKKIYDQKFAALSGNNIFKDDAPPSSVQGNHNFEIWTDGDQRNIKSTEEPVTKTAKKIYDQKFAELSGNNIFKDDAPPSSVEKTSSGAKLREMSGSNIFADGKVESRDYLGGVRKPPGGESSIALV